MLKLLIRKQFYEIFRSFFYDEKKKRARSKGSTALWILLFVFLVGGMLGGMFTMLSVSLCGGLLEEDLGWLYFLVLGLVSLFLGVFGSGIGRLCRRLRITYRRGTCGLTGCLGRDSIRLGANPARFSTDTALLG